MATKKVKINKPFKNANGQYNFAGSINLGTYPVFDDKFIDKDLYTIYKDNDVNKAILNNTGTVTISDTSHFTIDELVVKNAGVSYGVKNMKFIVYIADSSTGNYDPDTSNPLPDNSEIYNWSPGNQGEGWSPPESLISDGKIFTNLFDTDDVVYNAEYNAYPTTAVPTTVSIETETDGILQTGNIFDVDNLDNTLGSGDYATTQLGENPQIYVVVYMKADANRAFNITDKRMYRHQIFSIPANDIATLPDGEDLILNFGYEDSLVKDTGGGSGGAETPAFRCTSLRLKISIGGARSVNRYRRCIRLSFIYSTLRLPWNI